MYFKTYFRRGYFKKTVFYREMFFTGTPGTLEQLLHKILLRVYTI
jgi:hypothetical protein